MTPSSRETSSQLLDPPLRGESFSAEHLWEHAQEVARRQTLARRGAGDRQFADRFESNCRFIASTYHTIIESVRDQEPISPDAEWLVDNYYVVQEQLREIREDLPPSFYFELPKLSSPPFVGHPRAYELAYELVLHTDSSLDEELIVGFIASYQQVTSLTSGEIWASANEGKTWKWTRHLEKRADGSYHYPAVIQGRDGTIHAVYSYFLDGGKSMKHAAFNEAWVQAQ